MGNTPLTYRQLKSALDVLCDTELDMTVTLFDVSTNKLYVANDTLLGSELPSSEARESFFGCLDEDMPVITFGGTDED
jgi:hypothetical protein